MDIELMAKLAHNMETKEDLLNLLNFIKKEEMVEMGYADRFHPFTMRHINYYCNPNNAFHRYRQFKIRKKTGGFRQITAPRNRSFMLILQYLNEIFKALYTPSDYAMGFAAGRSVVTNAKVHQGQNYILNLDIKDFFPSIEQPRIWKRLQLKPFNFPIPIANVIAGLCSMKEIREEENGVRKEFYVLPQGAPTSPIITNMICDNLDRRLSGLAKRFGLHYTRYADDITFSSMHNVYQSEGEFFNELKRIIKGQGFIINDKKTRLQKLGARQEVTGIIISKKLKVTQKYVRDIRNILYMWDRYGYSTAYSKFYPKYKAEKGHVKKGMPDLINVIDGKLMYLKMVKGEDDPVYKKLHEKFLVLADEATNSNKKTAQNITYVETIPMIDFEKKNNTSVFFGMSEPTVAHETNIDNPNDVQEIVKPGHRFAYWILNDKKIYASVNKVVTAEYEDKKELLAVSSCRDSNNKPFWLVHKIDKITVPPVKTIDVDELNNELEQLLNS